MYEEQKQRIIQEIVPGKQVTMAHLIANPNPDLYKKLGVIGNPQGCHWHSDHHAPRGRDHWRRCCDKGRQCRYYLCRPVQRLLGHQWHGRRCRSSDEGCFKCARESPALCPGGDHEDMKARDYGRPCGLRQDDPQPAAQWLEADISEDPGSGVFAKLHRHAGGVSGAPLLAACADGHLRRGGCRAVYPRCDGGAFYVCPRPGRLLPHPGHRRGE